MSDKKSIDRVRDHEAADQPKKDRAKQKVAQDQSAIKQRARTFDDDAATRELRAGRDPAADESASTAEDNE